MICFLAVLAGAGCGPGVSYISTAEAIGSAPAIFSVSSYGAKGDGVADDGPSIQRAMTAAATANGGQVTFPCGEFLVGSIAASAPGGRSLLYLKGAKAVQLTGQGRCSHVFTKMPQKSVIEFNGSSQVSVTNMRITAVNAAYVETFGLDGGSAIRFTGVTNGSISRVEVDGASAGALYLTAGTSNSSVANNYIHDTLGAGIWEDDCGGANGQNCLPSMPPSNNVYDSNTLTNTTLSALSAIDLDDGSGSSHATIKNNTISWTKPTTAGNSQVHCIQMNNVSDVSVLNNSCTATPWDAIVITTGPGGHSQNVTIQGNTIQSTGTSPIGGSGIVVYDAPQGLGISAFTITYNSISLTGDHGIAMYAASKPGNVHDAVVQNNTIQMADQRSPGSHFGIDIESSAKIAVSSNTITGNGACIAIGVNVNASTATTPTATSNQVVNILGKALVIH